MLYSFIGLWERSTKADLCYINREAIFFLALDIWWYSYESPTNTNLCMFFHHQKSQACMHRYRIHECSYIGHWRHRREKKPCIRQHLSKNKEKPNDICTLSFLSSSYPSTCNYYSFINLSCYTQPATARLDGTVSSKLLHIWFRKHLN